MITRFFTDKVCIANYAESGLSANTFIGGKRLDKLLTQMKKGDYLLVEFGHNDQNRRDRVGELIILSPIISSNSSMRPV